MMEFDMNARSSNNEAALQTLAQRLLRLPFRSYDRDDIRIIVGDLDESMPINIPMPPDDHIVGSMIRGQRAWTVVLDSKQSPTQALAFFGERLAVIGWTKKDSPDTHGFTSSDRGPYSRVTYCRSIDDPTSSALTIYARAMDNNVTDVRLELETDPRYTPCGRPVTMGDAFKHIPPLVSPVSAEPRGQGGMGGNRRHVVFLDLDAHVGLRDLAMHYERQLDDAGWTRTDVGETDMLRWSAWTISDERGHPWHGFFFILNESDIVGRFHAQIRVEASNGLPLEGVEPRYGPK